MLKFEENSKGSIKDYFFFGKKLGEGAFAIVRPAKHLMTHKVFAIKTYYKLKMSDKDRQNTVDNEIKILERTEHPACIKLFDKFETRRNIHLVLEHGGEMDLKEALTLRWKGMERRITEDDGHLLRLFRSIVEGVQHLHEQDITHNDLKLENIVLSKEFDKPKIVDFGFGRLGSHKKMTMICGTPNYMAPELLAREPHFAKPCDVWALGVIFYFMLKKKFPFKGKTEVELVGDVALCDPDYKGIASYDAVNLLKSIFKVKAEERITCEEMLSSIYLASV